MGSIMVESEVPGLADERVNILLVDDRPDKLLALETVLASLGQHLVLAHSGTEALRHLLKQEFALIVLDVSMPGMDGFELLREIRALGSDAGGSVPVIAMTALVTHADGRRILNAGFQAYLPKPFTPDRLVETIMTVLDD